MRFTILLSLYTSIASSSYAFTSSLSYSIMKRRNNDGIYKSKLRAMYDVQEATQILQVYDAKQIAYVKKVGDTMTAGEASSKFVAMYDGDIEELQQAVLSLAKYAANEREESSLSSGRLMLGICGLNVEDCLATLKSWVTTLQLPRGLLHGADVAGVPIDTSTFGRAFVKYNTGGAMSFKELRESGRGFDALWIPGDAMLEGYDGDYRGIYLNVELNDDVFRQYGLLPLDLFDRDPR